MRIGQQFLEGAYLVSRNQEQSLDDLKKAEVVGLQTNTNNLNHMERILRSYL